MSSELTEVWKSLLAEGGARQRLVEHHPLHLYYGSDSSSRPVLVLITTKKPSLLVFSGAVDVQRGDRRDGSWALAITLLEVSLIETFVGMCVELIRRSSGGISSDQALERFYETLQQWRDILGRDPKRLSLESLRGLVGELSFALHELSAVRSPAEVVASWRGPYGAPHDFSLAGGELFEVKAVQPGARTVLISSVEQLDPVDDVPLTLCLKTVADAASEATDSMTVQDLLMELRATFPAGSGLFEELNHRLAALGFDEHDNFYGERSFVVSASRYFQVSGSFPRLRRDSTPVAIDKVEYRLRLSGIADFEMHVSTTPLHADHEADS